MCICRIRRRRLTKLINPLHALEDKLLEERGVIFAVLEKGYKIGDTRSLGEPTDPISPEVKQTRLPK